MSSIQDIHAFAERIYDIVQDYVDGNFNADDGKPEPDNDKNSDIANLSSTR